MAALPAPSVNGVSPRRWPRTEKACTKPRAGPSPPRASFALRACRSGRCRRTTPSASPPRAAGDDGKGAVLGQRLEALLGLGRLAVVVDAVAEPDDARRSFAAAPSSAVSSALTAASRSGANGCGSSAAAVERASAGASMRAVTALAALAVGTTTTARLWLSASAIRRSIMRVALAPVRGGGPAVVDEDRDRALACRARLRARGSSTGSASARMMKVAASRRMSVSHQGDLAGVFSWFSRPDEDARRREGDLTRARRHRAQQPVDDRQRRKRAEQPGIEESERAEAHGARLGCPRVRSWPCQR